MNEDYTLSTMASNDSENDPTTYDPETLKQMERDLIQKFPEMKLILENSRELSNTRLEQAQDSSVTLQNKRGYVTPALLKEYPNSPTAQYTTEALYMFLHAQEAFEAYQKDRVLTDSDCRSIQPGFHYYIQGYMIADHLSRQCLLPSNIAKLTRDYLGLRPNDTEAEYFNVIVINVLEAKGKSDYVGRKDEIRALEIFANKISEYKNVDSERAMLRHAYYILGAKYTTTDQNERAADAFRKCYNLDTSSISALYSLASHEMKKEPEKALQHLLWYLDRAPKCDEKYPHAHFCIASIYLTSLNNESEAVRYYHLGLDAEKHRLPFNHLCNLSIKRTLQVFVDARSMQNSRGSLTNC